MLQTDGKVSVHHTASLRLLTTSYNNYLSQLKALHLCVIQFVQKVVGCMTGLHAWLMQVAIIQMQHHVS